MTHGVVSKTANLEYQSESGATNEGLADFFGEAIEGHKDWVMGRELFIDPAQGVNGLRNLFDPHKTTYRWKDEDGNAIRKSAPAHLNEIFTFDGQMCGRTNDNCGVHMNATLIGHAGYLAVKAMGREKAEKVFYSTLVHFLTETSDFKAFGQGARQACAKLYAQGDCETLNQVLVQVGL
jgi:Zn-dependent metalloprotease